ncbi:MAG: hypothetical protein II859_00110 [Bacteroidales bacterium]|nr:hypothetical protein [Bacteroidales bacterium]
MQDLKIQNKPKNLRLGCHFYDEKMELDVYNGETSDTATIRYLVPLNKHVLEPLGFEAVYDEYTSEMYFQRDIEGYRIRTSPIGARIIIINLKYLHTLVDANGESLNELENFFHALGIPYENIFTKEALNGINSFGQHYYEYYEEHEKFLKQFNERFNKRTSNNK